MSIYKKYLAKDTRPHDLRETMDLCERLLGQSGANIEDLTCVLVVYGYKIVESRELSKISDFDFKADELLCHLSSMIGKGSDFSGVRTDFDHLYISLLTVMWHVDIFSKRDPSETFNKLLFFAKGNDKFALTTSQNIARGLLVYGYVKFLNNDFDGLEDLVKSLTRYLDKCFSKMSSAGFTRSTFLGDFLQAIKMLQSLYAGMDWIDPGARNLDSLWSVKAISRLAPRVKSEEFLLDLAGYLESF